MTPRQSPGGQSFQVDVAARRGAVSGQLLWRLGEAAVGRGVGRAVGHRVRPGFPVERRTYHLVIVINSD